MSFKKGDIVLVIEDKQSFREPLVGAVGMVIGMYNTTVTVSLFTPLEHYHRVSFYPKELVHYSGNQSLEDLL